MGQNLSGPPDPRDPGSPNLRMVSWSLNTLGFVSVTVHPKPSSSDVRRLDPLNHPKKVTKNCQVFFFYHSARGFHNTIYDHLYLKLDIFLALHMPSRLPPYFFRLNFSFDSFFSVWREKKRKPKQQENCGYTLG